MVQGQGMNTSLGSLDLAPATVHCQLCLQVAEKNGDVHAAPLRPGALLTSSAAFLWQVGVMDPITVVAGVFVYEVGPSDWGRWRR